MKVALVVGCANGLWEEVEQANALMESVGRTWHKVCCVKMTGIHWPTTFDVWATLHPEFMDDYEKQRKAKGLPGGYEIVAPLASEVGAHGEKGNIARRITYRWKGMTSSASSGIYGAKIMLDDGCDKVILAGIPLETGGNHFVRGKPWLQRDSFTVGFEVSLPFIRGKVKSMSGHTRKILGGPTPDWLLGDPQPVASAQIQA